MRVASTRAQERTISQSPTRLVRVAFLPRSARNLPAVSAWSGAISEKTLVTTEPVEYANTSYLDTAH